MTKYIFLIAIMFITSNVMAQDFVYRPINPAFGGDTFNYNWLLSSAQAQNNTSDPDAVTRTSSFERNALDDFQNSLNRQILSQLSRQVLGDQFGFESLQEGTFTVGDFTIDVTPSNNGILITIIDLTTGGQSVIEVPNL